MHTDLVRLSRSICVHLRLMHFCSHPSFSICQSTLYSAKAHLWRVTATIMTSRLKHKLELDQVNLNSAYLNESFVQVRPLFRMSLFVADMPV